MTESSAANQPGWRKFIFGLLRPVGTFGGLLLGLFLCVTVSLLSLIAATGSPAPPAMTPTITPLPTPGPTAVAMESPAPVSIPGSVVAETELAPVAALLWDSWVVLAVGFVAVMAGGTVAILLSRNRQLIKLQAENKQLALANEQLRMSNLQDKRGWDALRRRSNMVRGEIARLTGPPEPPR